MVFCVAGKIISALSGVGIKKITQASGKWNGIAVLLNIFR
jgi:hypothetical protein